MLPSLSYLHTVIQLIPVPGHLGDPYSQSAVDLNYNPIDLMLDVLLNNRIPATSLNFSLPIWLQPLVLLAFS